MSSKSKKIIAKKISNVARKVLFIGEEKKWAKELSEWAIVACLSLLVIVLLSILHTFSKGKGFQEFWESFFHVFESFEIVVVFIILIKLVYNYSKTLSGDATSLIKNYLETEIKSIDSFLKTETESVRHYLKSETELINSKVDTINAKVFDNTDLIEKYLNRSKIVFETGINEYDNKHLLALQRVLNALNEEVTEIYAIDNSDPIQWWSDTMTGYLALLAKWKALDTPHKRRTVSRIFVFDNNELLSPIVAKTITLHSLMGFRTYIYSKKMFDNIFEDLKKKHSFIIGKKEVVIWNSSIENKINFELREKKWFNVNCYQSFWDMDSNKYERNQTKSDIKWRNYYGQIISHKSLEILFEFVSHEDKLGSQNGLTKKKLEYWEKTPIQHMLLIDTLVNNVCCCKNANEVKQIEEVDNFGIEIKVTNCNTCGKGCRHETSSQEDKTFDFTPGNEIKDILIEYYSKNIEFIKNEVH